MYVCMYVCIYIYIYIAFETKSSSGFCAGSLPCTYSMVNYSIV